MEGRMRAWLLLQVESPQKVATGLYDALRDEFGDDCVVIRADIVDYVYNLVIPLDASTPEIMAAVHDKIVRLTGAKHHVIVPVIEHIPYPPSDAQGYITEEEVALGHEKTLLPGRQHASPGANAWG